jgi:NAD(P)-dependent dehydrogenase (short-subunit alcohol dehydrogenase family)
VGDGKGCGMDLDLQDKTVLVTGSSRGIGFQIAALFAKEAQQRARCHDQRRLCSCRWRRGEEPVTGGESLDRNLTSEAQAILDLTSRMHPESVAQFAFEEFAGILPGKLGSEFDMPR